MASDQTERASKCFRVSEAELDSSRWEVEKKNQRHVTIELRSMYVMVEVDLSV